MSDSSIVQTWRPVLMNFWDARETRFRGHGPTRPWSCSALEVWPRTSQREPPPKLGLSREHTVPLNVVAVALMADACDDLPTFAKVLARNVMSIVTTGEDLAIQDAELRDGLPKHVTERLRRAPDGGCTTGHLALWELEPNEVDLRYEAANERIGNGMRPISFESGNKPSDVVRLVEGRLAGILPRG